MKKIPLTQGEFSQVDDEDYDALSYYKWHLKRSIYTSYAVRWGGKINGRRVLVRMHRQIIGNHDSEIDHINRDGLDNRRKNLRLATRQQNMANRGIQKNNSTGFKGVSNTKSKCNPFQSIIRVNRKNIYLGCFPTPESAYERYCIAANKYFGEFAGFGYKDLAKRREKAIQEFDASKT